MNSFFTDPSLYRPRGWYRELQRYGGTGTNPLLSRRGLALQPADVSFLADDEKPQQRTLRPLDFTVLDRHLRLPFLRPSVRWFAARKTYVPAPRNPTPTAPAPKGKGGAGARVTRGGGGSVASGPARPAVMLFAGVSRPRWPEPKP